MSRSGYDECDDNDSGATWRSICWRGAVNSAMKGKRGQNFLRELLAALDALPEKILTDNELEDGVSFCALGAVYESRRLAEDRSDLTLPDSDDVDRIAQELNISEAMVREIFYVNDEVCRSYFQSQTEIPHDRWHRVRKWVVDNINNTPTEEIK